MVITYHGGRCFKVTFSDITLAFDPISKRSSLGAVKFGADIVFSSLNHPDANGIAEVTYGSKKPFSVDGPGEYEIGGITARGFGVPTIYENINQFTTLYQVTLEGINMVFLGALSSDELESSIRGSLGDIDILFVPIGGGDVLDVPAASKLATKLEARCIIPMQYTDAALTAFLKEMGSTNGKPIDKFTVKKKDLAMMEGEVIILSK